VKAPLTARQEPAPPDVAAPPAGVEVSASGVASRQLRAGRGGASPKPNDCVRLSYTSWKRDGSLHASTARDEPPATQCLRRAMPGVAEAVERMTVGEERRVWVPGRLTYRSKDADDPAPTDDLTFDLTLLEVLRAPGVPDDLQAPPPSAFKTASGLTLRVLAKGAGARHPQPNERMTVRFSGWTRDGALFESTELGGGRPASLSRADVVRGVGEGLSLMQIGEKARVWVPAALAFGDQPKRGAPAGDLVYDLELLAVE
jgi:peptidylprolyl isomerase